MAKKKKFNTPSPAGDTCIGPDCRKPVGDPVIKEIQITDKSPSGSLISDYLVPGNLAEYMYPYPTGVAFRPSMEKPTLTFLDLSDEQFRVYDFGTHQITLDNPMKLNVSKSGGHRVYTADGISHYIPKGWIHLYWKVKPLSPHFSF